MNSEGVFTPILLPIIIDSNQNYFALQHYNTNKLAIISGTPFYDSLGNIAMILICISSLDPLNLKKILEKTPKKGTRQNSSIFKNSNRAEPSKQLDLIVESLEMRKLLQDTAKAAHYDVPILLLGESGTGKEIFSEIIHSTSKRRDRPFVKVNCSAIPITLIDSELFGYEPNAFTGASSKGHCGLFEAANNGTILLDEVGDMPLDAQAKILRVLQTGEIFRVGSSKPRKVNVRIISATNKDLIQMVNEGLFRMDLYFRLSVIIFYILPLREHKADIVPLLLHYCHCFNKRYHAQKTLSDELLKIMKEYSWPGNIRELRNVIERMMIICVDNELTPNDFYSICGDHDRFMGKSVEQLPLEPVTVNGLPQLKEASDYLEEILVGRALKVGGTTRNEKNQRA